MQRRIKLLFDNLDRWRHLPAYQLERRADIFFSIYLPEIMQMKVGCEPSLVIPEFPVHIPAIYPDAKTNLSFRIDYLAVFKDPQRLVFLELKTDPRSKREEQDKYLKKARDVGMVKLLLGLQEICHKTSSREKYECLLSLLASGGLIVRKAPWEFESAQNLPKPEILYIQPSPGTSGEEVITFDEVANLICKHDDYLSHRFAQSLREWCSIAAGQIGAGSPSVNCSGSLTRGDGGSLASPYSGQNLSEWT
jgi:hypothetical protein